MPILRRRVVSAVLALWANDSRVAPGYTSKPTTPLTGAFGGTFVGSPPPRPSEPRGPVGRIISGLPKGVSCRHGQLTPAEDIFPTPNASGDGEGWNRSIFS